MERRNEGALQELKQLVSRLADVGSGQQSGTTLVALQAQAVVLPLDALSSSQDAEAAQLGAMVAMRLSDELQDAALFRAARKATASSLSSAGSAAR